MDPVGAGEHGGFRIVVDDERRAIAVAQWQKSLRFGDQLGPGEMLLPQLEQGDAAGEGFFYLLIQGAPERPGPVSHGVEQQHIFGQFHVFSLKEARKAAGSAQVMAPLITQAPFAPAARTAAILAGLMPPMA